MSFHHPLINFIIINSLHLMAVVIQLGRFVKIIKIFSKGLPSLRIRSLWTFWINCHPWNQRHSSLILILERVQFKRNEIISKKLIYIPTLTKQFILYFHHNISKYCPVFLGFVSCPCTFDFRVSFLILAKLTSY